MIPKADIVAWRQTAPWISDVQVEQDLVISRVLVSMFQDAVISEQLAFRGGTALHKLYLNPARRYSEDIDLVQSLLSVFCDMKCFVGVTDNDWFAFLSHQPEIDEVMVDIEEDCQVCTRILERTKSTSGRFTKRT
jgi:hypothetical protein